jgi:hypothetical protein
VRRLPMRLVRTLGLFCVLFSSTAMADGSSGQQTISSFAVDTKDQLVWVTGPTAWSNPDGRGSSNLALVQFSNPYYRDLLAEITTAYAAGKSVAFGLSGCVNSPWGNAPVVVTVVLY